GEIHTAALGNHPRPVGRRRDVGLDEANVGLGLLQVDHHDVGTRGREQPRCRQADARRTAGDDRDLAVERAHHAVTWDWPMPGIGSGRRDRSSGRRLPTTTERSSSGRSEPACTNVVPATNWARTPFALSVTKPWYGPARNGCPPCTASAQVGGNSKRVRYPWSGCRGS